MVAACPMCQLNLDVYQNQLNSHFGTSYRMPIVYFTQMMALALGMDAAELKFEEGFVSIGPLLEKWRTAHTPPRPHKRKSSKALPMPRLLSVDTPAGRERSVG
jgi:heterodisulfide reductase subunit B